MPYLTKEKTAEFFTKFGTRENNTGSVEAQIALLTERINRISEHLQGNKKDFYQHPQVDGPPELIQPCSCYFL